MQIDPERVVIPSEKLTDYLLSTTHPIGRYKSAFFLGLRYTPEVHKLLAADLTALLVSAAEAGGATHFGQKVASRGPITGPNGRTQSV